MNLVRCPKGHVFDADQHRECPVCSQDQPGFSKGLMGGSSDGDIPGTKVVNSPYSFTLPDAPMPGSFGQPGPFQPPFPPQAGPFGPGVQPGPFTPPAQPGPLGPGAQPGPFAPPMRPGPFGAGPQPGPFAPPMRSGPLGPGAQPGPFSPGFQPGPFGPGYRPPAPFAAPGARPGTDQERGKTRMFYSKTFSSEPIGGWLVCVMGSDRGKAFRVSVGKDTIGRSDTKKYKINLSDEKISRSHPMGVITYIPDSHEFYFTADPTGNLTPYVNGAPVLTQTVLRNYDELRIGGTVLLFRAFCSEKMNWEQTEGGSSWR